MLAQCRGPPKTNSYDILMMAYHTTGLDRTWLISGWHGCRLALAVVSGACAGAPMMTHCSWQHACTMALRYCVLAVHYHLMRIFQQQVAVVLLLQVLPALLLPVLLLPALLQLVVAVALTSL